MRLCWQSFVDASLNAPYLSRLTRDAIAVPGAEIHAAGLSPPDRDFGWSHGRDRPQSLYLERTRPMTADNVLHAVEVAEGRKGAAGRSDGVLNIALTGA